MGGGGGGGTCFASQVRGGLFLGREGGLVSEVYENHHIKINCYKHKYMLLLVYISKYTVTPALLEHINSWQRITYNEEKISCSGRNRRESINAVLDPIVNLFQNVCDNNFKWLFR